MNKFLGELYITEYCCFFCFITFLLDLLRD